jgi:C4-dicarboxylate transporter DctQ subunit
MSVQVDFFLNALKKIEDILGKKIVFFISCVMFVAMIGAMVFQVFCRFILRLSVPWSEEIIRYLFVSTTYLCSCLCVVKDNHIVIDIITVPINMTKQRTKDFLTKCVDVLSIIVAMVFCTIIMVLCYQLLYQAKVVGQLTPALGIPKWWIDLVIFVSWALMVLFYFTRLLVYLLSSANKMEVAK